MENINLKAIKEMLIKIDSIEDRKEKREYKERLIDFIKQHMEKSCNIHVKDVELKRDYYGFIIHTINNEYIKIRYNTKNNGCNIVYDGKFEINIKL